ncbi:ABC transporter substrate-binding protein [Paenibacillus sp. UNC451MF]|uniref:ABC transporter substrate-binding protein n=1 Tax=Paenibacillus sp. UNC451MF TaxID=1449063 RepID=UPI0004915A30|nr:ABC transporter substrate-binding protein [Paenibacillus sp. UNC451MF]
MRKRWILGTIVLLALTGCGSQAVTTPDPSNGNAVTSAASSSVTIKDFADRNVTFSSVPQKIAALGNGEMDIVYALGGTLVGRPTATGPTPIKALNDVVQIGSTHGIELEKLALVSPDAVLGTNPMNTKDIPAVEALGTKMVLTSANSIDDIKKQIQMFGQMIHKEDKAAELVDSVDKKVQEINKQQRAQKPRVLLVYGAPGTYMAALNNSLSGSILTTAGGENIAADYPKLDSYPQYALLNSEKIMKSNPQFVFIMSHGSPDKVKEGFMKEMQQNAAWNSLDAVINQHVEVLPADLFGTNPGTRIVDALDYMNKLLQTVK